MSDDTNNGPEIDIQHWSDELIQAVAMQHPRLIRGDDPFAVRDEEVLLYEQRVALCTMCEEEELPFIDFSRWKSRPGRGFFVPVQVGDQLWQICDWQAEGPGETFTVSERVKARGQIGLYDHEWSDEAVRAIAAQYPQRWQRLHTSSWLIADKDMPDLVISWRFEYYCSDQLLECFDMDGFITWLTERDFSPIEIDGERHWIFNDPHDGYPTSPSQIGVLHEGSISRCAWTAQMIQAAALQVPAALREESGEDVAATLDVRLRAILADEAAEQRLTGEAADAYITGALTGGEYHPMNHDGELWRVFVPTPYIPPAEDAPSPAQAGHPKA